MKLKKKYVVLEVETGLNNNELKSVYKIYPLIGGNTKVIQVQVSSIKPVKGVRSSYENLYNR